MVEKVEGSREGGLGGRERERVGVYKPKAYHRPSETRLEWEDERERKRVRER